MHRYSKDVEIWDYHRSKWNIDKSSQDDRDIGCHEVENQLLLDQSCIIAFLGFVIFKIIKSGSD